MSVISEIQSLPWAMFKLRESESTELFCEAIETCFNFQEPITRLSDAQYLQIAYDMAINNKPEKFLQFLSFHSNLKDPFWFQSTLFNTLMSHSNLSVKIQKLILQFCDLEILHIGIKKFPEFFNELTKPENLSVTFYLIHRKVGKFSKQPTLNSDLETSKLISELNLRLPLLDTQLPPGMHQKHLECLFRLFDYDYSNSMITLAKLGTLFPDPKSPSLSTQHRMYLEQESECSTVYKAAVICQEAGINMEKFEQFYKNEQLLEWIESGAITNENIDKFLTSEVLISASKRTKRF